MATESLHIARSNLWFQPRRTMAEEQAGLEKDKPLLEGITLAAGTHRLAPRGDAGSRSGPELVRSSTREALRCFIRSLCSRAPHGRGSSCQRGGAGMPGG